MIQPMRRLLLAILLLSPLPIRAEIASTAECEAAIASDPQLAREDAGQWSRSGGGVEARICEAAALEAMGATATAARLLSEVAANPGRSMPRDLRAILFEDAARLWAEAGQPGPARQALDRAVGLAQPGPDRLLRRARVSAALADWPAATRTLDALIAADPRDAEAFALRAASLRHEGRFTLAMESVRTALHLSPDLPQGLFEAGATAAEMGSRRLAESYWLELIGLHPDDPLAPLAERNLVRLREAD
jgi:tetratricopeptide (TPR) repeat protein